MITAREARLIAAAVLHADRAHHGKLETELHFGEKHSLILRLGSLEVKGNGAVDCLVKAGEMLAQTSRVPRRIQRKRVKGWKLPKNTKCVTRPGPWGNPYDTASEFNQAIECCSQLNGVPTWMDPQKGLRILWMLEHMEELRGFNLACYCPPTRRCHADMLLIWANLPCKK